MRPRLRQFQQRASWMPELAPDPGRDPQVTLKQLTDRLDLPVQAVPGHPRPARHVWHCPVRTDPATGTCPTRSGPRSPAASSTRPVPLPRTTTERADGSPYATPTTTSTSSPPSNAGTAAPHAVTTTTTARKRMPRDRSRPRAQTSQPRGRHPVKRPTSAERAKAERAGRAATARELLRDHVRQAAAGAENEAEFFRRLTEAGVRIDQRTAPSRDVLGYKVALPGDRNHAGEPIWFPGSRLAPDLSLPEIRQRLGTDEASDRRAAHARSHTGGAAPARARREAAAVIDHAPSALADGDEEDAAAHLSGLGEVLDALAQTSPVSTRQETIEAARAFERSTRWHTRAERADHRAIRAAARGTVRAGNALGQGEDGGATAMLLSTLVLATIRRRPLAHRPPARPAGSRCPAPACGVPNCRSHAPARNERPRTAPPLACPAAPHRRRRSRPPRPSRRAALRTRLCRPAGHSRPGTVRRTRPRSPPATRGRSTRAEHRRQRHRPPRLAPAPPRQRPRTRTPSPNYQDDPAAGANRPAPHSNTSQDSRPARAPTPTLNCKTKPWSLPTSPVTADQRSAEKIKLMATDAQRSRTTPPDTLPSGDPLLRLQRETEPDTLGSASPPTPSPSPSPASP